MALSNIACRRLLNSGLSSVHHLKRGGPASVSKNIFFFYVKTHYFTYLCHTYICGIFGYTFSCT